MANEPLASSDLSGSLSGKDLWERGKRTAASVASFAAELGFCSRAIKEEERWGLLIITLISFLCAKRRLDSLSHSLVSIWPWTAPSDRCETKQLSSHLQALSFTNSTTEGLNETPTSPIVGASSWNLTLFPISLLVLCTSIFLQNLIHPFSYANASLNAVSLLTPAVHHVTLKP